MAKKQPTDPYAPPPMHHDRSGGLVRFAIIAVLLGAAAWGYMAYSNGEQTAELTPPAEQQAANQQLADGTYQTTPQPTTTEAAPAAEPAPAAAPRASSPAPTPAQPVPAPSTTITPAPSE